MSHDRIRRIQYGPCDIGSETDNEMCQMGFDLFKGAVFLPDKYLYLFISMSKYLLCVIIEHPVNQRLIFIFYADLFCASENVTIIVESLFFKCI